MPKRKFQTRTKKQETKVQIAAARAVRRLSLGFLGLDACLELGACSLGFAVTGVLT
jgi:hypothetical protein